MTKHDEIEKKKNTGQIVIERFYKQLGIKDEIISELKNKLKDIKYLDEANLTGLFYRAGLHTADVSVKRLIDAILKLAIPEDDRDDIIKDLEGDLELEEDIGITRDNEIADLKKKCKELEEEIIKEKTITETTNAIAQDRIKELETQIDNYKHWQKAQQEVIRENLKCIGELKMFNANYAKKCKELKANINTLKSIHYQKEIADEVVIDDLKAKVDKLKINTNK